MQDLIKKKYWIISQINFKRITAKKWGSGLYRLIIWKTGGIREKNKYPAIDVIVDAGDNEDAAPIS